MLPLSHPFNTTRFVSDLNAQPAIDRHQSAHRTNWIFKSLAMVSLGFWPILCASANEPNDVVVSAQQTRQESMARAAQATIAVFGLDGGGGGSGVIVTDDGYALTNFHVTSACGDHMRCGLNDGTMVDAVIVGIDATGDVSLIKLLGERQFPTAPLGDSDQVRVGQWCFAAGNPFGLATNLQPSVSLGVVSGVGRYQYPSGTLLEYADCIQTDAAINPGNSGGPLFNMDAEVIGINGRCSFQKRGRVNVGVGYAISINQIKNFLGMLRSGRLVDHATLGATVSTDDNGKVLVSNILSGSDAYRRGLRYGDEVIGFAGRDVQTTNDFKNILGTLPKDWRVPLVVRREGKDETLLVRLAGVHSEQQLATLVAGESEDARPKMNPRRIPKPGDKPEKEDPKQPKPQQPDDKKQDQKEDIDSKDPAKDLSPEEAALPGRPDFKLVKSMLEKREGFANLHFNRLERQQVWSRIQKLGDFGALPAKWMFTGKFAAEPTNISILLSNDHGKLSIGKRPSELPFTDEFAKTVDRQQEQAILVAMRAWQQLLQEGPEKLGATVYIGTAPVYPIPSASKDPSTFMKPSFMNSVQICDVLQSDWYDTIVKFYVPVGASEISCIEVTGDPTRDPVELYLDQYVERDGRKWPGRVRLQYGTEPMLLLLLESVKTAEPSTEDAFDNAEDSSPAKGAK